ncbi:hypothetical protein [Sphingobium sp. YR768]|uniref:hypothetical protein n=1 Tax=Sphingobium sp. YR768 TaxID=1884365 RepID=UPI00115FB257|nr:hypothetical protein [Sphingobium sp. YR768]
MHFIVFHRQYDGPPIQRLQSGNGIVGLIGKKWSISPGPLSDPKPDRPLVATINGESVCRIAVRG